MDQHLSALPTRQELLVRLGEALTSDGDLAALIQFLRDDLAYAPTNRSIIGSVLRGSEFDAWRHLMTGVEWDADWPIHYDADRVRALSRKLLEEMEAT